MPDETNKKLEYLKRGEVRTMEKDLARFREQEAKEEREKVAKLRVGEEVKRGGERVAEAQKEAEERKRAEEEAKRRTGELEELKGKRMEKAASAEATAAEEKKKREELLEEKLRETQTKEEEERRRFLERVAAKAEGLAPSEVEGREEALITPPPPIIPPAPPKPVPPVKPGPPKEVRLPKIPKPPLPKITGVFPQKPSILSKIWVRIIVSLLIFAILALVATFWYWYLVIREETPPPPPPPPPIEEIIEEKSEIARPFINEKILNVGYHIPVVPRVIDTIIIHSIYNILSEDPYSVEGVIEEYKMYEVAAHYLITRDSAIYQTVPREAVAYQAGVSQMPDGRTNVNNFSIGIELIYTKEESPTEAQYLALAQLVKYLQEEYEIPGQNILGHRDVTPARKDDPWNFDWEKFQSLLE